MLEINSSAAAPTTTTATTHYNNYYYYWPLLCGRQSRLRASCLVCIAPDCSLDQWSNRPKAYKTIQPFMQYLSCHGLRC